MTSEHYSESFDQAKEYLGKKVNLVIDRPVGSRHPEHGFLYSVNYGHVPDTTAPDGEGIDAYFLGTNRPLSEAEGVCIGIIHRLNDNDDSLVVVAEGLFISDEEIVKSVNFQEQFFDFKLVK